MTLIHKLLWLILLLAEVYAESKSWDKECTTKFPGCERDEVWYTNTACERSTCGPKFEQCIELPPDEEFRQTMMDFHNELRNKLASGKDTTGGNKNAANMMAFSYDLGLEYTAICHVNGCLMEHDKCRGTEKFSSTSQNLAMQIRDEPDGVTEEIVQQFLKIDTFKELVQGWYDEIKLDNYADNIEKFTRFSHKTGHFTALVWATSAHIGCARAIDRSKTNEFTIHLTCNYGPGGNFIGAEMYKIGPGCSKCPSGVSCNSKYTALCGEDNNDAVSTGENPYRAEDKTNESQGNKDTSFSPNAYIYIVIFVYNTIHFCL